MHSPDEEARRNPRDLSWLFYGTSGSTREDIWHWWEQRRFRYNRDLFFVGTVTWLLVWIAGSAAVKPGVDFEEPIAMIFGPVFYAVLANLAYTAGPALDTAAYRGRPRKQLFKAGYIGSLILTALPGIWAVAAWTSTIVTGRKLD
jgi:hypothetical protein